MKKQFQILILIALVFASCNKEEDEIISRSYTLESFDTIQLNDFFDVYLTEGPSFKMEVKASKAFMDHIEFNVVNNELSINNTKRLKWTNPKNNAVSLYITSNGLKEVHANETCNIKTLNPITTTEFGIILKSKANFAELDFDNETVYYWNNHPCGGKLILRGQAKELKIWNTALMTVEAQNLVCEKVLVENRSKGNCSVNASERIEYLIDGEGDIEVFGRPNELVQKSPNSGGQLIIR